MGVLRHYHVRLQRSERPPYVVARVAVRLLLLGLLIVGVAAVLRYA